MALIQPTNNRLLALIGLVEGLRLHIYADSKGFPTIGYGHLIVRLDEIVAASATHMQGAVSECKGLYVRYGFQSRSTNAPVTFAAVESDIRRICSLTKADRILLWQGNNVHATVALTGASCLALRDADVNAKINGAVRHWPGVLMAGLPEQAQIVIVDFAFNGGPGLLLQPRFAAFRNAIANARWEDAAVECLNASGAGGVSSQLRRRQARAALLREIP